MLSRDAAFIESAREEVAELREHVRRLDPNHPSLDALVFLEIQMQGNRLVEAEAAARAAIQKIGSPKAANPIYIDYADILKTGHLFEEMEGYVDLYASFEPDAPGVGIRRQVLAEILLGPDRAIPLFRDNLMTFPNNLVSMHGFIVAPAWARQFDEAERVLATAPGCRRGRGLDPIHDIRKGLGTISTALLSKRLKEMEALSGRARRG